MTAMPPNKSRGGVKTDSVQGIHVCTMKYICGLLALMALVLPTPAQTSSRGNVFGIRSDEVSRAPLLLFTNGSGRVFPLQEGQMFKVGQECVMVADADRGFMFSNWTLVNVFTITEVYFDGSGNAHTTTTTDVSPVGVYTKTRLLRFTMRPVEVFMDEPGVLTITESVGWQANFVPVRKGAGLGGW
jgi:hypothetical protein